ncbi:hypothetical protein ACFXPY_33500 [Streptomyces sp. NPDC059153]|uniref:hypothetical protein n=1 Tax=Streptomyces sp. NPDC059153 TaxID=3346743 RepID=UPI0036A74A6D
MPGSPLSHTTRLALDAWTRLHGEHVFPRDKDDEFLAPSAFGLSGPPGRLRALVPFAVSSPVGRGVGMYSQRELARYVSAVLDQPWSSAHRSPAAAPSAMAECCSTTVPPSFA